MPCGDCSTDDLCRCGPGEVCGHCFETARAMGRVVILPEVPKGSEPSSTECEAVRTDGKHCFHKDTDKCCGCEEPRRGCQHLNKQYTGALYDGPAGCKTFLYYSCPDCKERWKEEEPRCEGCGHHEGEGCGCPPRCICGCPKSAHMGRPRGCVKHGFHEYEPDAFQPEDPPMTPEEEEEALRDCACGEPQASGTVHRTDGPCFIETTAPEDEGACIHEHGCGRLLEDACHHGCRDAADELSREANEMEPPPPQPDRRPPCLLAYSVQGHLYEVALPGDATVRAIDGALVITHHLAPVAGIVQIRPLVSEES